MNIKLNKKQQEILKELIETEILDMKTVESDSSISVDDRAAIKAERIELEILLKQF